MGVSTKFTIYDDDDVQQYVSLIEGEERARAPKENVSVVKGRLTLVDLRKPFLIMIFFSKNI